MNTLCLVNQWLGMACLSFASPKLGLAGAFEQKHTVSPLEGLIKIDTSI
jgi:hypothetical protein